jgi:hypothetical protein
MRLISLCRGVFARFDVVSAKTGLSGNKLRSAERRVCAKSSPWHCFGRLQNRTGSELLHLGAPLEIGVARCRLAYDRWSAGGWRGAGTSATMAYRAGKLKLELHTQAVDRIAKQRRPCAYGCTGPFVWSSVYHKSGVLVKGGTGSVSWRALRLVVRFRGRKNDSRQGAKLAEDRSFTYTVGQGAP